MILEAGRRLFFTAISDIHAGGGATDSNIFLTMNNTLKNTLKTARSYKHHFSRLFILHIIMMVSDHYDDNDDSTG